MTLTWNASSLHGYDECFVVDFQALSSSPSSLTTTAAREEESDDDFESVRHKRINDLAVELSKVPWLPSHFVALVLQHHMDVDTIKDLSSDDLRKYFFVDDAELRARILSYIRLCGTIQETRQREAEETRAAAAAGAGESVA